jgi:hypothetical protein
MADLRMQEQHRTMRKASWVDVIAIMAGMREIEPRAWQMRLEGKVLLGIK